MFDGYHHMWGMHWGWWIFGILVIIVMIWAVSMARRSAVPTEGPADTPLKALERRYAQGEISTEEYEERRARLEGGR